MERAKKTSPPRSRPVDLAALIADAFAQRDQHLGVPLHEPLSAPTLVRRYGGALDPGLDETFLVRVAPIDVAGPQDLAPLTSRRFVRAAQTSKAVLLVDAALASLVPEGRRIVHEQASTALARLLLDAAPPSPEPRATRRDAHVERGARVSRSAVIGAGAVILRGALIGPGARIEPNAVIYGGVVIGARVIVGAGAVIGRPGFGWAPSPGGGVMHIPQLGGVHIEDDAEIGPLATVDAGTLGPTVVERGAKLDAMVHVGHNARIGAHAVVAAQAGFAGSSRVGRGVLVGGQAGVADHLVVGDGARLAAKAGVIGDVDPGVTVAGYPAVLRSRWLRAVAKSMAKR